MQAAAAADDEGETHAERLQRLKEQAAAAVLAQESGPRAKPKSRKGRDKKNAAAAASVPASQVEGGAVAIQGQGGQQQGQANGKRMQQRRVGRRQRAELKALKTRAAGTKDAPATENVAAASADIGGKGSKKQGMQQNASALRRRQRREQERAAAAATGKGSS